MSSPPRSAGEQTPPLWHSLPPEEVARALGVSLHGLTPEEAHERLRRFGPNRLRPPRATPRWRIFLHQFRSPLIYILLAAAVVALLLGERSDAGFIAAVLMINALIGFVNEARAEQQVLALASLVRSRARVRRGARVLEVDSEAIVPGDLMLLESGLRVPADVRLLEGHGLRVDESLLTGESVPVDKEASLLLAPQTPLADRRNMVFAGTAAVSGRGIGLVVATAERTEVGAIAGELASIPREPPPLIRRLERFARVIGVAAIGLIGALVAVGLVRGEPVTEMLLAAIALAVSAVPEGLPVALTVALAVAVSRMARRRVVVRHLPAVEALGSCGVIASDKTGTLTRNELTVERIVAGAAVFSATGVGYAPEGELLHDGRPVVVAEHPRLFRLLRAGCLANEGTLVESADGGWEWSGDPTDVALLCVAAKARLDVGALWDAHPLLAMLPFEPERRYAASFHGDEHGTLVCVKGAPENVLALCTHEATDAAERRPLDRSAAMARVEALMAEGYRVIAIADGRRSEPLTEGAPPPEPRDLDFLGLVAMTDPPREGVPAAIATCQRAGVRVVMVTGDHATTARAIAQRIGLSAAEASTLTGPEIAELDDEALTQRVAGCSVVARATPTDKLRVVRAIQNGGDFVAVTGDGVNDAPALRQADIGVAMGQAGTDVAREAADIVITDDDFSSIVAGVEEGRVAYDNVRKVTYLLVSTGFGEVVLVALALALGLPIPFTAVQLLWLNLVTNGIQDVALAFEPGEPGVMERPPRPPRERIFDPIMVRRTLLAGAVMGGLGLLEWTTWTAAGVPITEARNQMLQLFVLFEIFHIGNCRSERTSLFRLSPLRNPVLLLGTGAAVAVHLWAMYTPFFQELLSMRPLRLDEWIGLALPAAAIVVVIELDKAWRARR